MHSQKGFRLQFDYLHRKLKLLKVGTHVDVFVLQNSMIHYLKEDFKELESLT